MEGVREEESSMKVGRDDEEGGGLVSPIGCLLIGIDGEEIHWQILDKGQFEQTLDIVRWISRGSACKSESVSVLSRIERLWWRCFSILSILVRMSSSSFGRESSEVIVRCSYFCCCCCGGWAVVSISRSPLPQPEWRCPSISQANKKNRSIIALKYVYILNYTCCWCAIWSCKYLIMVALKSRTRFISKRSISRFISLEMFSKSCWHRVTFASPCIMKTQFKPTQSPLQIYSKQPLLHRAEPDPAYRSCWPASFSRCSPAVWSVASGRAANFGIPIRKRCKYGIDWQPN